MACASASMSASICWSNRLRDRPKIVTAIAMSGGILFTGIWHGSAPISSGNPAGRPDLARPGNADVDHLSGGALGSGADGFRFIQALLVSDHRLYRPSRPGSVDMGVEDEAKDLGEGHG